MVEHERNRHLNQRHPSLVRQLSQCLGRLKLALVPGQREVVALRQTLGARALRRLPSLPPATGEPASGKWAPSDRPESVLLQDRQYLGFDATDEDRVRRLLTDEACVSSFLRYPLRRHDLARRIRRGADVTDLPRPHEI